MTDLLALALDDLVPSFAEEQPDWEDVLARSQSPARRRSLPPWPWHPRRLVALAFALLLVVLLATPAFGVRGYLLHLLRQNVSFSGSPAAPNIVKKEFLDLPVGAPAEWMPEPIAAQARTVGTFMMGRHRSRLWVVPTKQGGYCYQFENAWGGCRNTAADRTGSAGGIGLEMRQTAPVGQIEYTILVGGDLTNPASTTLTAHYADGSRVDVPFVWVGKPISAGFFTYNVPKAHWAVANGLISVTVQARDGRRLAIEKLPRVRNLPPRRLGVTPFHPQTLPMTPRVRPSVPLQRGSDNGVSVVAGRNGWVQFRVNTQTRQVRRLLAQRSATFDCFRLTHEFGIFDTSGVGPDGVFASRVAFQVTGITPPFDACEIEGSQGHAWPDPLGNHSEVEIPFTVAGRAYFTDRAAARDLALFVRSRRVQSLRREPAAQAKATILSVYGKQLAQRPIRITATAANTLVFSERSPTGKRFTVTVRNGRVANQDLAPYAFVF